MHFISVRIQFLTEIRNKIRHEDIRDYMNLVEENRRGRRYFWFHIMKMIFRIYVIRYMRLMGAGF